jgi:hypothetical protein
MKYILNIKLPGRSIAETRPTVYQLLDDIPIVTFRNSSWPAPNESPPDYGMTFHSILVDLTPEALTVVKLRIPGVEIIPDLRS